MKELDTLVQIYKALIASARTSNPLRIPESECRWDSRTRAVFKSFHDSEVITKLFSGVQSANELAFEDDPFSSETTVPYFPGVFSESFLLTPLEEHLSEDALERCRQKIARFLEKGSGIIVVDRYFMGLYCIYLLCILFIFVTVFQASKVTDEDPNRIPLPSFGFSQDVMENIGGLIDVVFAKDYTHESWKTRNPDTIQVLINYNTSIMIQVWRLFE